MASLKNEPYNNIVSDAFEEFMKFKSEEIKKNKRPQKRRRIADDFDEDNKNIQDTQMCGEFKQKVLSNMNRQLASRKKINDNLKKHLTDAKLSLEDDYSVLKNNAKELEEATSGAVKCLLQTTSAIKQRINDFKDIELMFMKTCDDMEKEQLNEINKLNADLDNVMKAVKEKMVNAVKKNYFDMLQNFFHNAESSL